MLGGDPLSLGAIMYGDYWGRSPDSWEQEQWGTQGNGDVNRIFEGGISSACTLISRHNSK